MSKIVAWDTETYRGKAVLITKPGAFCEPKSWEQCIRFIARDKETACFNMDYDVQAILTYTPRSVRDRLAMLNEARWGFWRIRYVRSKFCKVWYDDRLVLTVYDIQQFYNSSLAKVAEKLGIGTKKPLPQSWYRDIKGKLENPKTRRKVIDYALNDAVVLQKIIERTVEAFRVVGLDFEKPFSNASFAERYFRKRLRTRVPRWVEDFARQAYHGGRIECLQAGYFSRAWLYDINSAYPSVIAGLVRPNGSWVFNAELRDDAVYGYFDIRVSIPYEGVHAGVIPLRKRSGVILYPVGRFRKVVTLPEYRYLVERGWVEKVYKNVQHIWPKWNYDFKEIYELYARRKAYPETSYAIKIILNSTYGKMAQVLVHRERHNVLDSSSELFDGRVWKKVEQFRSHTSFVYASEITARTRMRLLDFDPAHVIFYATDGVMTDRPVDIKTSGELGDWGEPTEVRNLIVVGSGVYAYEAKNEAGEWVPFVKARGFSKSLDLAERLKKAGRLHRVPVTVLRNTSLKQAMRRPRDFNILADQRRFLDVNFDRKRHWTTRWNAGQIATENFQSKPWVYYPPVTVMR